MENKDFIYQLILSNYTGTLDSRQLSELKEWIEQSPENEKEYNEIIKLLEYYDRLELMKKIDVDHDLRIVKNRLKRKSFGNILLLGFQRVAAILLLPLIVYSLWPHSKLPVEKEKSAVVMKTAETAPGVRSQIVLSDGTKVWLNSGSNLSYPAEFTGVTREVSLSGEGYFQVESNESHPFVVDLNGYKVTATGTRFNISNYPEDDEIKTYLEKGKVSFGKTSDNENLAIIKEKEAVVLKKSAKQFRVEKADGRKSLAWIDGLLMFRNDNTADVAARLGRWYNADIVFDKELSGSGYVFTATFRGETLEEALKLLSYSSPISFKIIPSVWLDDSSFSKRKVIISKK